MPVRLLDTTPRWLRLTLGCSSAVLVVTGIGLFFGQLTQFDITPFTLLRQKVDLPDDSLGRLSLVRSGSGLNSNSLTDHSPLLRVLRYPLEGSDDLFRYRSRLSISDRDSLDSNYRDYLCHCSGQEHFVSIEQFIGRDVSLMDLVA